MYGFSRKGTLYRRKSRSDRRNAAASDDRSAFAATSRKYTWPDIRAWCKTKCMDSAGRVRCTGGNPDQIGGTQPPAMTGVRLRPQAESTHGRTSARGVKRNVWIQQEGYVVPAEIQIRSEERSRQR